MKLSRFCIERPVFSTTLSLFMLFLGFLSYDRIPLRELPNIDIPIVSVNTVLPGAGADIIDEQVTDVIEEQISTLPGVRHIRSTSSDSLSSIIVEFEVDSRPDVVALDVKDRVARSRYLLPDDAQETLVEKLDINAFPIMWVAISSDRRSAVEVSDIARYTIKERLQALPGVGLVTLGGEKRRALRVEPCPLRMAAAGISWSDITRALTEQNIELPAGRVVGSEREFTLKLEGKKRSVEAFKRLRISSKEGAPLFLEDVAQVRMDIENTRTVGRFNSLVATGLGIIKQTNANTVEVARGVKTLLEKLREELPADVKLSIAFDSSTYVESSIQEVEDTLILSCILVAVIIYLFIGRLQAALIPILVIPISLAAAMSVIHFMGFTLNNLTLLALVLSVGVVVDDAIVILEGCSRRLRVNSDRRLAALWTMEQLGFAVVATSAVLVAVFLPIALIDGQIGKVFYEFGVTVSSVIIASTLVALTLTPTLCRFWLGSHPKEGGGLLESNSFEGHSLEGCSNRGYSSEESTFNETVDNTQKSPNKHHGAHSVRKIIDSAGTTKIKGNESLRKRFMMRYRALMHTCGMKLASIDNASIDNASIDNASPNPDSPSPDSRRSRSLNSGNLTSRWLSRIKEMFLSMGRVSRLLTRNFQHSFHRIEKGYAQLLRYCLHHPTQLFLTTIAIILFSGLIAAAIPKEFVPPGDRGVFIITVKAPEGSTLEYTSQRLSKVEEILAANPAVNSYFSAVALAQSGVDGDVRDGLIFVTLKDYSERSRMAKLAQVSSQSQVSTLGPHRKGISFDQESVMHTLREKVKDICGLDIVLARLDPLSRSDNNQDFQMVLKSSSIDNLKRLTATFAQALAKHEGIIEVDHNLRIDKPQIFLTPRSELLQRYGVSLPQITQLLNIAFAGGDFGYYEVEGRRYKVILQLHESDRQHLDNLKQLFIKSASGELISLDTFVDIRYGVGASKIVRFDRNKSVTVSANLQGITLSEAAIYAERVAQETLDESVQWELVGGAAQMEESLNALYYALALAIGMIYFSLCLQFESFLDPLIIIGSLPLAFIGSFTTLYLFDATINIYSMIGMIMLMGLVAKNSILLVDKLRPLKGVIDGVCAYDGAPSEMNGEISELSCKKIDSQRAFSSIVESTIESATERFRAIVMTALSTLIGIMPLAFAVGIGAQERRPLGLSVVGGLLSSSLLTLIVIPTLYVALYSWLARLRSRTRANRHER